MTVIADVKCINIFASGDSVVNLSGVVLVGIMWRVQCLWNWYFSVQALHNYIIRYIMQCRHIITRNLILYVSRQRCHILILAYTTRSNFNAVVLCDLHQG